MSFESAAPRTSGYAIASFVLGIAGFFGFPIVAAILAIVFGHKARKEISSGVASGDGLATAGIILGWVGIVTSAIALLLFIMWIL